MRFLIKNPLLIFALVIIASSVIGVMAPAIVNAQVDIQPCSTGQVSSTMSVVGNRLNFGEGQAIKISVHMENLSNEPCTALYELKIDEKSGLTITSDSPDWQTNTPQGISLLLKPQILGAGYQKKSFSAEMRNNSPPSSSNRYRLTGELRNPDAATNYALASDEKDWREIWVWDDKNDSVTSSSQCKNSAPVNLQEMNVEGGGSITPLSLSFDCEFGYSMLEASITGIEIDKMGLRLQPRNSVGGSGSSRSYSPYFASPEDELQERYTIVFDDLPDDVSGLRLAIEGIENHELVSTDSKRPEDRALQELTDAYEVGVDSVFTTGAYLAVFGVILFALLWMILIPPRLGGWASQRYQWNLVGLTWTAMSLGLIVGTFALVSWAVSSFSTAINGGNSFGVAYFGGTLLGAFGLLTLTLFMIAVTRARLSASSNRRTAGTMLPWWLQNPLKTVAGAPSSGGQQNRPRRNGGHTYLGMLKGRRRSRTGNRRKSARTASIGWNWIPILVAAGVASVTASALLTP